MFLVCWVANCARLLIALCGVRCGLFVYSLLAGIRLFNLGVAIAMVLVWLIVCLVVLLLLCCCFVISFCFVFSVGTSAIEFVLICFDLLFICDCV